MAEPGGAFVLLRAGSLSGVGGVGSLLTCCSPCSDLCARSLDKSAMFRVNFERLQGETVIRVWG